MKRDATFHYMTLWKSIQYHYSEDENGNLPQEVVGMQSGGGHGVGEKSVELAEMPQMYCIRVFWDGKIVEELITR